MDAGRVSFETIREYYGIWRWKIERQSSNRLAKLWTQIGSSSLDDAAKVSLANVAWALASFERSYDVLVEDIDHRFDEGSRCRDPSPDIAPALLEGGGAEVMT